MKIIYLANIRLPTEKAHGIQIMKMCEAFKSVGYDVELIVPWRFNALKDDPFDYYGIKKKFKITRIFSLDMVWAGKVGFWLHLLSFSKMAALYLLFKKRDMTDMIYSRDEVPLYYASFFGKNIFWETHAGRFNFLIKRLIKKCKRIITISDGLKKFYIEKGVKASKILVAHDAISLGDFANDIGKIAAKERLHLPLDKYIVMYIGRVDGWKGVETLLEGSKIMSRETKVVVMGGEPDQTKELKDKYPNIIFLGFRPYKELAENQAAADVLILPNTGKDKTSAHFTSPLKLFSYMASSRPIVSSDLPSIREILNENNAIFFKPDEPLSLAKSVEKVLRNADLSDKISKQALLDVREYTWEKRAGKITEFMESIYDDK